MDYRLAQIIPHLVPDEENPGLYARGSFTAAEESEIVHRLEAWQADIARFLGRPVELRIFVNTFRDFKDNEVKRKGIYVQFRDRDAYHELVYGHPVGNETWRKPPGYDDNFRRWQDDLRDAVDNFKRADGDRRLAEHYSRQINERDWVPDHFMIEQRDYGLMYFVAKYYRDELDPWLLEAATALIEGATWTPTVEHLAVYGVPERFSDWLNEHYEGYAHRRVDEWASAVSYQVRESGAPQHIIHDFLEDVDDYLADGEVPPVLMFFGLDYGFPFHMMTGHRDELPTLYGSLKVDDVVLGSMDGDSDRVMYLDSLPLARVGELGLPWAFINELSHLIDELDLTPNQGREMIQRLFDISDLGYHITEAQPYDNFEQLKGKDTSVLVSVNPNPIWTTARVRQLMEEFATHMDYHIEWRVALIRGEVMQPVLIVRFNHERLARLVYLLNKVVKRLPPRDFRSFIVSMDLDTHPNPILPKEQWLYFSFLSTTRPIHLMGRRDVQNAAAQYRINTNNTEELVRRLATASATGVKSEPVPNRFDALASGSHGGYVEGGGRGRGRGGYVEGGGRGRGGYSDRGRGRGGARGRGGQEHESTSGWFTTRRRK